MTRNMQFGVGPEGRKETELRRAIGDGVEEDATLQQALTDFRASVHAWSQAASGRPRNAELTFRQRSWRLVAGWALGCVLVAGGVSGAILQHEQQQHAARLAAAQQLAQQKQLAAEQQRMRREEDHNLMAKVDNDTSQEVPTAMEPLARMMEEGQIQ